MQVKFSTHVTSSLHNDDLQAILCLVLKHGMSLRQLEREFSLNRKTLSRILHGHKVKRNRGSIRSALFMALKREKERIQNSRQHDKMHDIQDDICELILYESQ